MRRENSPKRVAGTGLLCAAWPELGSGFAARPMRPGAHRPHLASTLFRGASNLMLGGSKGAQKEIENHWVRLPASPVFQWGGRENRTRTTLGEHGVLDRQTRICQLSLNLNPALYGSIFRLKGIWHVPITSVFSSKRA